MCRSKLWGRSLYLYKRSSRNAKQDKQTNKQTNKQMNKQTNEQATSKPGPNVHKQIPQATHTGAPVPAHETATALWAQVQNTNPCHRQEPRNDNGQPQTVTNNNGQENKQTDRHPYGLALLALCSAVALSLTSQSRTASDRASRSWTL